MALTTKTSVAIIFACALLMNKAVAQSGGNVTANEKTDNRYSQQLLAQIDVLMANDSTRNITTFRQFVENIDEAWRKENRNDYAWVIRSVCIGLTRFNIPPDVDLAKIFARSYALKALEKPDEVWFGSELELIRSVQAQTVGSNAVVGKEFAAQRKEDTIIRLHCWKRWMDTIDPNWDYEKAKLRFQPLPQDWSGKRIPIESITDPDLRKKYNEVMEKNSQIAKINQDQSILRQSESSIHKLLDEVAEAYSMGPYDTEELRGLIHDFDINNNEANKLLNSVEAKIGERQKELADRPVVAPRKQPRAKFQP
jgi:hypothetical protein